MAEYIAKNKEELEKLNEEQLLEISNVLNPYA